MASEGSVTTTTGHSAAFGRKRSISAARSGTTPSSRADCRTRASSASQACSCASARIPTIARQASQGEPQVQSMVGSFYAEGVGGLEKNEAEAARLFKLAAD